MTICRICKNVKLKKIILKEFTIVQCEKCHFGLLEPYPTQNEVDSIYQAEYFIEKTHSDHINDSKFKFLYVNKFLVKKPYVLDFGCGTGNFLHSAKVAGWNAYGFDISEFAAKKVANDLMIPTKYGKVNEKSYENNFFDCITCFDVIEHLTDFKDTLRYFLKWLKPNGYLFISTPDIKSWDAKLLGKKWYGYKKFPEHINFFSPQSIKILLQNNGFEIKVVKTWGFVRSFDYIINHSSLPNGVKDVFLSILTKTKLSEKEVYIPMVDMMVVAQKR